MDLRVICSLRFIKADESAYNFEVGNFRLLKGREFLDSSIFTENLITQAGHILIKEYLNYPYFFGNFDIESIDQMPVRTNKFHSQLNQICNFLWFIKDCSVNVGVLHTFIPDTERLMQNFKLGSFSNSEGNFNKTNISLGDFDQALALIEKFYKHSSDDSSIELPKVEYSSRPQVTDSTYHYAEYNKSTRIERAVSFLSMARTNSFLPLKISLYMSLLECLFTTDRQEVTHKVCERVALYIGGSFDEKIKNYKTIKEAYDIRSGFFHGQDIEKKQDARTNLTVHSKKVDELLRKILNKVILEDGAIFNSDKATRAIYFQKLIFDQNTKTADF